MRYATAVVRKKSDPSRIKSSMIQLRCKPGEKEAWEAASDQDGAATLSEWLRALANARAAVVRGEDVAAPVSRKPKKK